MSGLDNRIRVTPVLSYRRDTGGGRIEGRLNSEDLKTLKALMARQPFTEAPAIEARGLPLIEMLEPRQRRLLLAAAIEFMSLPGPRSLALSGDRVIKHAAQRYPINRTCLNTEPDDTPSELIHDDQNPMRA